jgi:hypothetical protein
MAILDKKMAFEVFYFVTPIKLQIYKDLNIIYHLGGV